MPDQRILYPISYLFREVLPGELINTLDEQLNRVLINPSEIQVEWSNQGMLMKYRIYINETVSFDLPFLSDFSIYLGRPGEFIYFDIGLSSEPAFRLYIEHLQLTLHASSDILQEYELHEDAWRPKESVEGYNLTWGTGLSIDVKGDFNIMTPELTAVPPFMIGDTGFILEFGPTEGSSETPLFRYIDGNVPELLQDKVPFGFKGFYISDAGLHYSKPDSGTRLPRIGIHEAAIGSGGFTGDVVVGNLNEDPTVTKEQLDNADFERDTFFQGGLAFEIGGMEVLLWHLSLSFYQSIPDAFLVTGVTFLPFADKWMTFKMNVGGPDADFMLELGGTVGEPLIELENELLEIEAESIAYKLKDEIHYAIISGSIRPKIPGFDWPKMKVDKLSISSEGDIDIEGGWLVPPEAITLDFHGFQIGISEIGFGTEGESDEEKKQWLGFSGSMALTQGIPISASVSGLKFSWYKNPGPGRDGVDVSLRGIAVSLEIPNTLRFEGSVSYEKLDGTNPDGLSGDLFKGNVSINLIALRMEVEGQIIIGKLKDLDGNEFTAFYLFLSAELPSAIPLGATGTGLYGIAGLFGMHVGPTRTEEQSWYEWYKADPAYNITHIRKWTPMYDNYAFGAGITIGTIYDDGFSINLGAMLVVLIPGPVIMLDGKANIVKQRSDDKTAEGAFHLLAVFDGRAGTFQLNLDVRYSLEDVVTISGGMEAFFDFNSSDNWYIHIGKREPESKRIQALVLSFLRANLYLMIEPTGFQTGASVSLGWQATYGPLYISLLAKIAFHVGIFWKPKQLEGMLLLHGEIVIKLFGIGLNIILEMLLEGQTPNPYRLYGKARVEIGLPWPLPEVKAEVELLWEKTGRPEPVWPLLKGGSLAHHKVAGGKWEWLSAAPEEVSSGLSSTDEAVRQAQIDAIPVAPVDIRPVLSFARPIVNLHQVGSETPLLQLKPDEVGGRTFEYRLDELELQVWEDGIWTPVLQGINEATDDSFILTADSSFVNGPDANEPLIQLWQYSANDRRNQYERETPTSEDMGPCRRSSTQFRVVNWYGADSEDYGSEFNYEELQFQVEAAGQSARVQSDNLYTRNVFIRFPEHTFRVWIVINPQTGGSPDGEAYGEGRRLGGSVTPAPVLQFHYDGLETVHLRFDSDRSMIIQQIIYQFRVYRNRPLPAPRDRHPAADEQHHPGSLKLEPNRIYQLAAATSVWADGERAQEQHESFFFRTDDGPGIPWDPQLLEGEPDETELLTYWESPVNQFASYLAYTTPADGAPNHYYGYDLGIDFSEIYAQQLFRNLEIRLIDRNGRSPEDAGPGFFLTEGIFPFLGDGWLTWLGAREEGGCADGSAPDVRHPHFTYPMPALRAHRQYVAQVSLETSGERREQVHEFQFTTSRFGSFREHILSAHAEEWTDDSRPHRIIPKSIPEVSMELPAAPQIERLATLRQSVLDTAARWYRAGTPALDKARLAKVFEEERQALHQESATLFAQLDAGVREGFNRISALPDLPVLADLRREGFTGLEQGERPLPEQFTVILVRADTPAGRQTLLLLESPEPINWLRVQAEWRTGIGGSSRMTFVWNEDQTRAFTFPGFLPVFEVGVRFHFDGFPFPDGEVLLRDGRIVEEVVEWFMAFDGIVIEPPIGDPVVPGFG